MTTPSDIVAQFDRFFFGCEADDATISWAFADRVNPLGATLQPMLGSDIGHWDVPDMRDVLPEAYELVEASSCCHSRSSARSPATTPSACTAA